LRQNSKGRILVKKRGTEEDREAQKTPGRSERLEEVKSGVSLPEWPGRKREDCNNKKQA